MVRDLRRDGSAAGCARTGRFAIGLLAAFLGSLPLVAASSADLRLIDAVKSRDLRGIRALVEQGVDIDAKQPGGATALAWAVHLQDRETVDRLLASGAEVNTADEYGDTPLILASANGDLYMIERLVAAGADATAERWSGETALMLASGTGVAGAVGLLAERGSPLDATETRRGQTALMWAAAEGHSDVVEALIAAGAEVNIASAEGFTALAFAVTSDDVRSIRALLAAGADPNAASEDGSLPTNIAASYGHADALEVLLDAGGDFSRGDQDGRTPLYAAAQAGDSESVSLLLDAGADPNIATAAVESHGSNRNLRRTDGQDTPLLAAAIGAYIGVMRQLTAAGADPHARTQDGATLLMQAARAGKLPVVEYAYTLDDDISAETSIGRTVMHAAVLPSGNGASQEEICEVIRFLASKGVDTDPIDDGGRTAISTADVWPLESASMLLYELTVASGREPKILPTDLR